MNTKTTSAVIAALALLPLSGCMVGPKYKTPAAITAPAFKEAPPVDFGEKDGWKPGQPGDTALKGNWWELFNDGQLNTLETQVDSANQSLKAAEANFRAARAQIGYARASEAPTIGVAPAVSAVRDSAHQPYFNQSLANNGTGNFSLPVDLNYEIDLWGRVRRGVTAARANAQAMDADMENARLSLHAELAMDYFGVRSADAQTKLLQDTVKAYEDAYQLTEDRYEGGASPQSDVAQAKTQLDQARVQLADIEVQRTQYEHAIAVLIGKAPAELTLAPMPINIQAPTMPRVPGVLPAALLERRPDIAGDERRMASANEQIGIAQAAYYPTLSLSGIAGFEGTSAVNWFSWPSRFWAVGPQLSETIFDAGRRRSTKDMTVAQYDGTVANYRQTVLTAFQQVEDNLAGLRVLAHEAQLQHEATDSAQQSLSLFQTRYEGGVDTYLQVVTWQTAALVNQRNDLQIMQRRLDTSVLLIKALGGGWNTSQMPPL
jgi:NodT family efflux transporter outer membrane factor (OMF) lipoprotein